MRTICRRGVSCIAVGVALGAGPIAVVRADDEVSMHRVTYTVSSDQPADADIYYRDVDPPNWVEYSHNPYPFSPKDDVRLTPGTLWVHETMLDDPAQWAMVTVSAAGPAVRDGQTFRCRLSVDGVAVDRAEGPRGALCSLRHW
ncbi:hypothetical protein ACXPWS_10505 [Mycobacterium sp. BMJ-28]